MAVVRWDPWREMSVLERQMNDLFGWMRRPTAGGPSDRMWTPLIEAYEQGDNLTIRVELAGVAPEDVELTVEGDTLCIRGERREQRSSTEEGGWIRREFSSGRFERTMQLEPGTNVDEITAHVEHGILEVVVPQSARSQTRHIEIEAQAGGQGRKPGEHREAAGEGRIDISTSEEQRVRGEQPSSGSPRS